MSTIRVYALAASLVCSVLNTKVTGQRSLNRVLGRFEVSNFPDQNHVGVMSQNTAKRRSKRQANLGVDLNLVDTIQLVLDRVFGRDDLVLWTADFQQAAVQRRRFTRTGRSGDQT